MLARVRADTFRLLFSYTDFQIFPEVGLFSPGHQPVIADSALHVRQIADVPFFSLDLQSGPNSSGNVAFFWEIMAGLIAAMVLLFGLAKLGPNLGIFGLKLINRKQEVRRLWLLVRLSSRSGVRADDPPPPPSSPASQRLRNKLNSPRT